jgi:hypothetical protein
MSWRWRCEHPASAPDGRDRDRFRARFRVRVRARWPVAGGWSLVAGRWWLVAGRWSLVAGRWSLVARCRSLVPGGTCAPEADRRRVPHPENAARLGALRRTEPEGSTAAFSPRHPERASTDLPPPRHPERASTASESKGLWLAGVATPRERPRRLRGLSQILRLVAGCRPLLAQDDEGRKAGCRPLLAQDDEGKCVRRPRERRGRGGVNTPRPLPMAVTVTGSVPVSVPDGQSLVAGRWCPVAGFNPPSTAGSHGDPMHCSPEVTR